MKKLILLISLMLFGVTYVRAQSGIKVPNAVSQALNNRFPKAQNIHWGMENAHEYEADFVLNGTRMSANFSPKGKWVETETTISENQLPKAVRRSLSMNFNGYEIGNAASVEAPGKSTVYEIIVKKGGKSHEVVFNSRGKQLHPEESGEEGHENGEEGDGGI